MTDFIADGFSLTTTPTVIVHTSEFDRSVIVRVYNDNVRLSFDSNLNGFLPIQSTGNYATYLEFILPSGVDLYSWVDAGIGGIELIVSKVK